MSKVKQSKIDGVASTSQEGICLLDEFSGYILVEERPYLLVEERPYSLVEERPGEGRKRAIRCSDGGVASGLFQLEIHITKDRSHAAQQLIS